MLAAPSVFENEGVEVNSNQNTNTIDLISDDASGVANIKVEVVLSSDTSVEASDGASESEVEVVQAPPVKRRSRRGIKLDGDTIEVNCFNSQNKSKSTSRVVHHVAE